MLSSSHADETGGGGKGNLDGSFMLPVVAVSPSHCRRSNSRGSRLWSNWRKSV